MAEPSTKTAWRLAGLATLVCTVTLVGMIATPLIARTPSDTRWLPFVLIPFIVGLLVVFIHLAQELHRLGQQVRELREQVEAIHRPDAGGGREHG